MLTQKKLKEFLHYNQDTGIFHWVVDRGNNVKMGDIAGTTWRGYIFININKTMHRAHRLAWLYVYGEFPKNEIDHINHKKNDNKISNLRVVTRVENCKNVSLARNSTSGVAGVYWHKNSKKWMAHIRKDGKLKYLGLFVDINEAKKVREKAKIEYGYHPNHGLKNLQRS